MSRLWILFLLSFVACSKAPPSLEEKTLSIQLSSEPASLDFSLSEDGASVRVLSAMMRGLMSYGLNYEPRLELAESMEVFDGKRYRFRLKPWKWSDGVDVTARDFVYGLKRTLDPKTPAKLADSLFFIRGARAYKKGALKNFANVGIKALDEKTLEFILERKTKFFPYLMTLIVSLPQREDLHQQYGDQWPRHMVSTGPYRLKNWMSDQSIELERNPHYPDFPEGAPEGVLFRFLVEDATALSLFEKGKLDVLTRVPALDLERLRAQGVIQEFPFFATLYVGFNHRHPLWREARSRRAAAMSIDREAIVKATGGADFAAKSWIPHGFPGANESIGIAYNPRATGLLWKHVGKPKISFGFDTSSRNQAIAEKVSADLKTNLDVEVKLQHWDWKTFLREMGHAPPAMFRLGWLAPFVDAYADLMLFESSNPNNYTGWKSSKFDALLREIAALDPGTSKRQAKIDEAHRLLLEEEVVVVPIHHYAQPMVVSKRVKNFAVNGLGAIDFPATRFSNE